MTSFDNRVFLFDYEWKTYMRRMPVRYITKRKHSETCSICGKPPYENNKLEHSHIIPFGIGVKCLGLTPDFLDSNDNIVSAHKVTCNKNAELSLDECKELLFARGHKLPEYLNKE